MVRGRPRTGTDIINSDDDDEWNRVPTSAHVSGPEGTDLGDDTGVRSPTRVTAATPPSARAVPLTNSSVATTFGVHSTVVRPTRPTAVVTLEQQQTGSGVQRPSDGGRQSIGKQSVTSSSISSSSHWSSKSTPSSPAQQQQRSNHPSASSVNQSSSSSLGLNIGLIVGIGTSIVILLLIAGYAIYRYREGCFHGGQRGSYRLDTAASAAAVDHHHVHTGNKMLLPTSASSCGIAGAANAANGSASSPLGGVFHLSRSKSNCKIPTKEWYV